MTHTVKLILDKPARSLAPASAEGHPQRVIRWPLLCRNRSQQHNG